MYFKTSLRLSGFRLFFMVFLCGSFLPLYGCGLYVGEKRKDPISQKGSTLGCMNDLSQQFRDYLDYKLEEDKIGSLAECLQSALLVFKYHVWGEDKQVYTPDELRSFIHEFFLQDQEISDNLMKELMIFKTSIVGGETNLLTAKEIDQVVGRIEAFKGFLFRIYPHGKILSNKEFKSVDEMELSLGYVREAILDFFNILFQKPYSLNSADNLFDQMGVLLDVSKADTFNVVGALSAFKPFIFSHSSNMDIVLPQQWDPLLSAMVDLLSISIYLQSTVEEKNYLKNKVDYFSHSFEYFLSFLEKSIGKKGQNPITQKNIEDLLQALLDQNLIPDSVSISSMQNIAQIVFGKIISQKDDFVIGKTEYDWMKSEYEKWKDTQWAIDQSRLWFEEHTSYSVNHIFNFNFSFDFSIPEFFDKIENLISFRPLYKEEAEKDFNIYFVNNASIDWDSFKYKNLTMSSFYSTTVQLLFRGYAEKFPERGVTQQELVNLFWDIHEVFKGFGVQILGDNLNSANFGNMEFLVANLLTYTTQGYYTDSWIKEDGKRIELINQREAVEYFSIIQSVFNVAGKLSEELEELCSPLIGKPCFDRNILSAVEKSIINMPHAVKEISKMSLEDKKQYKDTLFRLAIMNSDNKESIEYLQRSHLSNLAFAFLYQEIMFTRFDVNSDDLLEEEEVLEAFPLYQGMIQYVAEDLFCLVDVDQMWEEELDLAIYLFSAHYRAPPRFDDNAGKMEQFIQSAKLKFRSTFSLWDLELNRLLLMELAHNLIDGFLKNVKNCEESLSEN